MIEMDNHKSKINTLKKNIKNKSFKIGVIGVVYVGIKLVLEFANKNFHVSCFDKDFTKLKKIKSGISPFSHLRGYPLTTFTEFPFRVLSTLRAKKFSDER